MKEEAFDSYGFRTTKKVLTIQSHFDDPEQQKIDVERWKQLLPELERLKLEDQKKLVEEVKKGIPTSIRPLVWSKIIMPPLKDYRSFKITEYDKEIDRDINRTIPTNKRDLQIQEKLREVLNIVALAFPEMGYCQGLNFIAGNLLLIMPPHQTYNTMFHILYWQNHASLMSDMSRMHSKLYCLDKLTKKHYPQLFKFLQKNNIESMLYACSWFVTLFNNILPCHYSFRIMELYFLQGNKIIYQVCLQILKQKKKIVKKLSESEQIISELKNYEQFNKGMEQRFFNQLNLIKVTNKEIEQYETEGQNLNIQ